MELLGPEAQYFKSMYCKTRIILYIILSQQELNYMDFSYELDAKMCTNVFNFNLKNHQYPYNFEVQILSTNYIIYNIYIKSVQYTEIFKFVIFKVYSKLLFEWQIHIKQLLGHMYI